METRQPQSRTALRPSRITRTAMLVLGIILIAAPAQAAPALVGAAHTTGTEHAVFLPLVMKPYPPHQLEQIAFESDRDGNFEIYVMESDGSNQTRLTFNAADDYAAAWSPDGAHIAFTSRRDGGFDIYVMNADGSNQVRLTTTGQDSWPSWSPDGSKILFQSTRDGNAELYVMDPNGSNQTRLTNTAHNETSPEFSPDGSKIVYEIVSNEFFNNTTQGDIYVMNANGTNPTRLTFDQHNDLYPTWSADGQRIAFFSQRPPYGIFVMQANGSNVTWLLNGDEPDFSPDGTRIAYFGANGVNVAEADGNQAHLIAHHPSGYDRWPAWHP